MPTVQLLNTQRLNLRPFVAQDRPALVALQGDTQVMRLYGNGQALEAAQIELVHEAHMRCREKSYWAWAITLSGQDDAIGQVTAGPVEWNAEQWIELCWLLTPGQWRKGYGSEAVAAVIQHGIRDLGWQKIMAGSDLRNEASLRLMHKCGMNYSHEEMDSHGRMRRIFTHIVPLTPGVRPVSPADTMEVIAAAR